MYYVYLLKDDKGDLYVGYSKDLKRRITEHKTKRVLATFKMKNPKLIYYEAYEKEESAKIRELKLKQYGSSYQGLKKRLSIM